MSSEKRCKRSVPLHMRDWLEAIRFEADVLANKQYCGDWKINLSGHFAMPFHIIGEGGCQLQTRSGTRLLTAGDWLFFPRDTWHNLLPLEGGTSGVSILCGQIRTVSAAAVPLFDWLPDVWHVSGLADRAGDSLRLITRLFIQESENEDSRLILNRLCEALMLLLLRDYAEAFDDCGGLAAAVDPRLSRALQAMHQQPESPWTVESLATTAAMSRTAFALAFHACTGKSPIDYLTCWRMNRAALLLKESRSSVIQVAEAVGYQSESAFRKAFQRVIGKPLSAYRH